MKITLPETGYLRLSQIIGQPEITPEQAKRKQEKACSIRNQFPVTSLDPQQKKKEKRLLAKKLSEVGPRSSRPAIPAIIPVSKSSWWAGVKSGRYLWSEKPSTFLSQLLF